MNPVNKSSQGIPSRKGVHFRTPSSDKKAKEKAALPKNEKPATPTVAKPIEKAPSGSSKKSNKSNTSINNGAKTPAEMSHEKGLLQLENSLKAKLSSEIKKNSLLKKEIFRQSVERFRLKSISLLAATVIGFIAFVLLAVMLVFTYYRSITKYRLDNTDYSIVGYDYIDMNDTSENNLERIEERKTGKEKQALNLNDKIIIFNSSPYVPYSAIKDYFELSVAGDEQSRTIIVGSSNSDYTGINSAQFRFDTNEITVNGSKQILSCTPLLRENELYIPYEFIELYVNGILIDKRYDNNKTNISITKSLPQIYLGGSSNMPLSAPVISEYFSTTQASHQYTVDVSMYEKYISPEDPDKYLLLVNTSNKLSADYTPDDLINVKTSPSRPTQQICRDAGMALTALLRAAEAAGFNDLAVTGGYRSYSYQTSMFNQKLELNLKNHDKATAERITAETVLYPGASEHQSGLCVDMHNMTTAMQSFSNTNAYRWLIEHCADFGFILRYPQSKEDITGVKFEPWHFRFVGRTHAQKIMSEGLALEEYLSSYTPED